VVRIPLVILIQKRDQVALSVAHRSFSPSLAAVRFRDQLIEG
jgi:hypothetical protein